MNMDVPFSFLKTLAIMRMIYGLEASKQYVLDTTYIDQLCDVQCKIFEAAVRSPVQCMSVCSETSGCESVVLQMGNNSCHGYDVTYPCDGQATHLPGAKFYRNVPCPDGWTVFKDSCYYYDARTIDFATAQTFCASMDSKLVEIESPTEDAFIRSFLAAQGGKFWIGITDEEEEDVWIMAESRQILTYLNWGANQPNNGRVSNCGAIWESFLYNWVDERCYRLFQPVCEKATRSAN